ncbi:MAG: VRR-NUC domain-containing protein [Burkholderia gladioli]
MLEHVIETCLVERVHAIGGAAYKFTSPARRSVPDRLVVLPGGKIAFVECKRPGGRLTRAQAREHDRLRALGCSVWIVDTRESVDAFIEQAIA